MPQLDVSVALTNPYTLDRFDVLRRIETVDASGLAQSTVSLLTKIPGVVYVDGDQSMKRSEDRTQQDKHITILTRFALRASSKAVIPVPQSYQPDLVLWSKNNYIVESLEDYSRYGQGFVKASACIFDYVATPIVMPSELELRRTLVYVAVTIIDASTFSIPVNPVPESTQVFKNGTLVSPGDYSWVGNVATLKQPLDLTGETPDNLDVFVS